MEVYLTVMYCDSFCVNVTKAVITHMFPLHSTIFQYESFSIALPSRKVRKS
jgi:hypothetical protein